MLVITRGYVFSNVWLTWQTQKIHRLDVWHGLDPSSKSQKIHEVEAARISMNSRHIPWNHICSWWNHVKSPFFMVKSQFFMFKSPCSMICSWWNHHFSWWTPRNLTMIGWSALWIILGCLGCPRPRRICWSPAAVAFGAVPSIMAMHVLVVDLWPWWLKPTLYLYIYIFILCIIRYIYIYYIYMIYWYIYIYVYIYL